MKNKHHVCSKCGTPCFFDGRCNDDPVLQCKCAKEGYWVQDRCGGYWQSDSNAHPIPVGEYENK